MSYNLPTPPTLQGSEAQQLVQLHRYLFKISEMINNATTAETLVIQDIAEQQKQVVHTKELDEELAGQYNRAKSLIIKTADIVRAEMDEIVTKLKSDYVAKSEWGEYREEISQQITTTANSVVQSFEYDAKIDAVGADFEEYRIKSSGYIQSGIIGFEDDGMPIFGIAIGQDLANKTVTVDGVAYETIDMDRNLATYTADRVTFWQNGIAVAHISNSEMVINRIRLLGDLVFGGNWSITHTRGFAIKWVGGNNGNNNLYRIRK